MTWVKLDDHFPEHPKVLALGDDYESGIALHIQGLCYSAANLTDGFIPTLKFKSDAATIARLVDVGLWETVDGGHRIHDFLDYNLSKEQVEARRESWRGRQQKSRMMSRRDNTRDSASESRVESLSPVPLSPKEEVHCPKSEKCADSDAFKTWWSVYPLKQGKGAARTAYARAAKKSDAEALLAGVERYKLSRSVKDGFVCLPATWLNQERWQDEPETHGAPETSGAPVDLLKGAIW